MSRGHSYASESWARRACRKTSGVVTCAPWRSGVVFVTFPCLLPLHMATTATQSSEYARIRGKKLGRCSHWRCPLTFAHFGAASLML